MAKTRTFRVIQGRMHFKCHNCQARRLYSVPPAVRQRTIQCHKCKERTRCSFNRRLSRREQQMGRVEVRLNDGVQIEVSLADISFNGVGFDVMYRDTRRMREGREIQFRCSWNPKLFGSDRYVIRSIKGQRIGAQRVWKTGSE